MYVRTAASATKPRQRSAPVCARLLRSRSLALAHSQKHDYFTRKTLAQIAPNLGRTSKKTIEDIKSKGTAAIYCDNIIAYLNEILNSPEPEPTPVDIEKYKADLQNWIEAGKRAHEGQLEMFRSVITAGQNAIKSAFLLNGGAAVALLAFIAHLAEHDRAKVPEFGCGMLPFAFGVLAIAMSSGLTYLSQWLYASPKPVARKWGFAFNIGCIVLGIFSYLLFLWGLFSVYIMFRSYQ